jgi:hypothetical protein
MKSEYLNNRRKQEQGFLKKSTSTQSKINSKNPENPPKYIA